MTHAHITTWLVALILFFVALSLHKSGKEKGMKIVHMVLRLFYILILATGGMMFSDLYSVSLEYILKAVVGIWVIASMEMILVRSKKKQQTSVLWIQFVIAFLIVMYLGLRLPLGMDFF
jgi:hypothetical protein